MDVFGNLPFMTTHRLWLSFPEGEAFVDQEVCDADVVSHSVGAGQRDGQRMLVCLLLNEHKRAHYIRADGV